MYKRNYKKVDVMLFHPRIFSFVLLFLLFGCNTSSTEKICTVANEQTLTCNGGYSYWINPLYATSADVLAVSGVKKSNYYYFSSYLTLNLLNINLIFNDNYHTGSCLCRKNKIRWSQFLIKMLNAVGFLYYKFKASIHLEINNENKILDSKKDIFYTFFYKKIELPFI